MSPSLFILPGTWYIIAEKLRASCFTGALNKKNTAPLRMSRHAGGGCAITRSADAFSPDGSGRPSFAAGCGSPPLWHHAHGMPAFLWSPRYQHALKNRHGINASDLQHKCHHQQNRHTYVRVSPLTCSTNNPKTGRKCKMQGVPFYCRRVVGGENVGVLMLITKRSLPYISVTVVDFRKKSSARHSWHHCKEFHFIVGVSWAGRTLVY